MIPKTIHYCWFGRNPKPKLAEKCIKSWKKYCPDYEIIEWNEDNFDISAAPLYVRQAYDAKKWAFVTDYVRLWVVYQNGGIYMDTDVELRKSLGPFLSYQAFFGFEDGIHVNTGIGFGAEQGTLILKEMMSDYDEIPFLCEDGNFDTTPCPKRNTEVFLRHGLKQNNQTQTLNDNVIIFSSDYFSPISYKTGMKNITKNTVSIHWFAASWHTEEQRKQHAKRIRKKKMDPYLKPIKKAVKAVVGEACVKSIKKALHK